MARVRTLYHSQKLTTAAMQIAEKAAMQIAEKAAMQIAEKKVCAHRS